LLLLAGIALSFGYWWRIARRDRRLVVIYLAALAGAFFGVKVVYFFAEGWLRLGRPDMWLQLATGKSILGGLLGGYVGVEWAKRWVGYTEPTGDWFALMVPAGIVIGRIGCWTQGCCQGIECALAWFTINDAAGHARWPAVPVEILFNLAALAGIYWLHRAKLLPGQHFHLYLMAYGLFRFLHEFVRDEPRVLGHLTGYQIAAVAVFALGCIGFFRRQRVRKTKVVLRTMTTERSAQNLSAT
jgi:phosphatidylglycerol:prolipoprotein diacylglycerol transferase